MAATKSAVDNHIMVPPTMGYSTPSISVIRVLNIFSLLTALKFDPCHEKQANHTDFS
jgi:hypothetical protein